MGVRATDSGTLSTHQYGMVIGMIRNTLNDVWATAASAARASGAEAEKQLLAGLAEGLSPPDHETSRIKIQGISSPEAGGQ